MFLKWPREEWQELKLELLTTQVPKSGTIDLMTPNAMSGLWVVLSMKWPLSDLLSEPVISKSCMPRFKEASTNLFLDFIQMT